MGIWPTRSYAWWESQRALPPISILSRSAVRRAAPLTKYCAHVMEEVGGFEPDTPIVFGSCLGSISVLFSLLEQMAEDGVEGLSPIRFSGSVHHAPASTVGVSNAHKGFLNAISANEDLSAMALLEAIMTANEHGETMVVIAEEAWPPAFGPVFEPFAAALVLTPGQDRNLSLQMSSQPYQSPLPDLLDGNPAAPIQHLMDWFETAKVGEYHVLCPALNGKSWVAICE